MQPYQAKLVAAATGSTVTALTMTPFDVVKTRLQTQPPAHSQPRSLFPKAPITCCQPPNVACVRKMSSLAHVSVSSDVVCIWDHGVFRTERVNGFSDAIRHVWRAEGFPGLWKGAGTTLLIGVPSSTAYMMTYDWLLNEALPPLIPTSSLVPLYAGVIARTAITTVASPLELLRTNLQSTPPAGTTHSLPSVIRSLRKHVRKNGSLSLWRGLGPTLWRDVPFSGLYWASYQTCKDALARQNFHGPSVAFVSGAASGILAALITSPFDVLKTRRQALLMSSSSRGVSRTIPLLKTIWRTEGYSALYAGILPRMAKIAPACGIMIACYEVSLFLRRLTS
ncbi:mitochondrial carrier domain-containing protein [Flagelloscypha sp. PMI_526]|nr:mitochondrial carrier domain-containing protein [Flagelloscypha sp. PMI_526]